MFTKITKIIFALLVCGAFFYTTQTTKAESFRLEEQSFQKITLHYADLEYWKKIPHNFTSIAIQTNQELDLSVFLNPNQPTEKTFEFEENFSDLIFTNPTQNFLLHSNSKIKDKDKASLKLIVYFFDTRLSQNRENLVAGTTQLNGLKIITRQEWGADETLRYYDPKEEEESSDSSGSNGVSATVAACNAKIQAYPNEYNYANVIKTEKGNVLKWPLQYSESIKKIVVHHTGETNIQNGRPSDEMVRAIYYYHTIVKGWGDIGYHYVVGKDGEIFEGKAGGDKVVGAHVYCNNIGTVAVSVMGNFEKETPSLKQINSLKAILGKLSTKYNLNVEQESYFHGEKSPNLVGHRDLGATACPGQNLYKLLPQIRKEVASGFVYNFTETTSTTEQKDYQAEVDKKVTVLKMNPTHQAEVTFTFKNTGKNTWEANTWLHVSLNKNENAWADSVVPDKNFVAADMQEKSVKPGQTATFKATINAGYNQGFYILEFAPVVNNKYKLSKAAIMQPIEIAEPNYSYAFITAKHPPTPFYTKQTAEASVQLKNTGNIIWRNYGENKMYLGTTSPQDRQSLFSSDGRKTRLGYLQEREVKPGEIAHFILPLTAPDRRGIYKEGFAPVIEGIRWLEDKGMNFRIITKEPEYKIEFSKTERTLSYDPGIQRTLTVYYQNQSDVSWSADEIFFKLVGDYQALGIENNTITLKEGLTKNSKGSFPLEIKTPFKGGMYKLSILPVIRGEKFTEMSPHKIQIIVKKPTAKGETILKIETPLKIDLKELEIKTLKIKNTSNFTWEQKGENGTMLVPLSQKSRLYVQGKWVSKNIVSYMKEETVKPGETATFSLYLNPQYKGYYNETFKIKINNIGYVNGIIVPLKIIANPPEVKASTSSTKTSTKTTTTTTTTKIVATEKTNTPTGTEKIEQINPIRVKLSVPQMQNYILTSKNDFSVKNSEGVSLFKLTGNQSANVTKIGTSFNIQVGSQTKFSNNFVVFEPVQNGIMEIVNWQHSPAWNQSLNDNLFRGSIEIRLIDNKVSVINELPLEDYLKGIAEVSNGDPLEKLKTMTILARSYALFYLQPENEKFPGQPYDASDDPEVFQKYLGYGLEKRSPNFVEALKATNGEVVTYNGKLVKTPYFNQSDGRTLSAEEVWGWTHTPYLVSVADPYCNGLTRNGHGVGLSGYGATQMAKAGKNYQEIIQYYYQNVIISKI